MSAVLILALAAVATSCSHDDDTPAEQPSAVGTFTDPRDGHTYHFVHLAGLDWTVENLAYDLGDLDKCRVYQSVEAANAGVYSTQLLDKYGMLYTYGGATEAVPSGWRLPTDAEWSALENSRGYLDAAFAMLYGGYYTKNTYATVANGSRFMGSWAYFWTSTADDSKVGQYYFTRKKFYDQPQFERQSLEPTAYFLSVRCVR